MGAINEHTEMQPINVLGIILGASEWPHAQRLNINRTQHSENPFTKSKNFIYSYFRSSVGLNLPPDNILDLFDTNKSPYEINRSIEQFLIDRSEKNRCLSDIIFYYVGHGDYFDRNSYYIATRYLDSTHIKTTRYDISDVVELFLELAGSCRHILIIDACFAAGAMGAFVRQDIQNPAKRVNEIVRRHVPERGSALFCASGSDTFAKTLPGSSYSMFTGALARALEDPPESGRALYTLRELGRKTEQIIRRQFGRTGVIPEIHTPIADDGDIADVALFPSINQPISKLFYEDVARESEKDLNNISEPNIVSHDDTGPERNIGSVALSASRTQNHASSDKFITNPHSIYAYLKMAKSYLKFITITTVASFSAYFVFDVFQEKGVNPEREQRELQHRIAEMDDLNTLYSIENDNPDPIIQYLASKRIERILENKKLDSEKEDGLGRQENSAGKNLDKEELIDSLMISGNAALFGGGGTSSSKFVGRENVELCLIASEVKSVAKEVVELFGENSQVVNLIPFDYNSQSDLRLMRECNYVLVGTEGEYSRTKNRLNSCGFGEIFPKLVDPKVIRFPVLITDIIDCG